MRRTIAILGATGSIGTQALDIARRYPDHFYPVCLTAHASAEKLFQLVREFRPRVAALEIEPREIPEDVKFCRWIFGKNSSARVLAESGAEDALCAIVGIAGLDAVWTALDHCQRVLLANKEALVTGGNLVMEKAARLNKPLLPVDSEHSAIFQCLQGAGPNRPRRLILTASGGALRDFPLENLYYATPADVLKHPTWVMGKKITVDCATMLNKGLEVIEAHYLFHMPVEKIHVTIHPQSVVHSMVEFEDGAVLAQMGNPDMRGPIGYAMGYPHRLDYQARSLDFAAFSQLTFQAPDLKRYPCLGLALEAIRAGGTAPVILNGANEVAVAAFLMERIPFGAIAETVEKTLNRIQTAPVRSIEDVYAADALARKTAEQFLAK
ncbi:MAG: 1-deoxy-D-xylulose-5-phosphate reductoisomerase [Eubacteriales bacterium]|nr:1-deoxy-D-xylulose-5-phosphate reductoisomerase [Eubacteriales bacterium]